MLAVLEVSSNKIVAVGTALTAIAPQLSILSMKGNPSVCSLALTLKVGVNYNDSIK